MRHSDSGTTLSFYVQTPAEESRAALHKIEDWIRSIQSSNLVTTVCKSLTGR